MTPAPRQFGLSLIELMVSVTLGLLILSGVLVVFVNTSAARNEVERTSRQIENGRYASELLTEDLRLAGFYGELNVAASPCRVRCRAIRARSRRATGVHGYRFIFRGTTTLASSRPTARCRISGPIPTFS